jgi:hypothetical protein
MFLVAVALGFAAAGTYVGRNLTFGTAEICEFGALGMIIVQMFLAPVREGSIGMCGCLLWRCCWGSASDP